ncbi:MAG: DNA polymerase/3'-5' exonuclease PolX [Cyanobacteria bacterium NC_groundwater_1444_Ag_S-0.65um_54_12]|nr:DNA polymerase/3'-5' exonuclease PolX [Cyanobacteria bacterium NC_groundwater_1444_Ag_S-0.65um_54_12]
MQNEAVARLLENIAAALQLKAENIFRIRAYEEAARNIRFLKEDIAENWRQGRLTEVPGIGTSIAQKIGEFLQTGKSAYLQELCDGYPVAFLELLKIPGIGPRRAKLLYDHFHVTKLDDLADLARRQQIRQIRGMGPKTEEQLSRELARLGQRTQRLPLGIAWPLAERIASLLRNSPAVGQAEPAGSIRRRLETIGDIDILVASDRFAEIRKLIADLPLTKEILASGSTKITFLTAEDFQVDIRIVPQESWGAALQYFTGSKEHNVALRELAVQKGYKLSEYGIFEVESGRKVGGRTEAEVYELLGLTPIPPELREKRGEIAAAAAGSLPRLITLADVKGDFHVHSNYSDGNSSIAAMVESAIAHGYQYLAITDHSIGLGIARGINQEKAWRQWEEIRRLNKQYAPFRILSGVELEVRATGELDLSEELLAGFDFICASVHSGTRSDAERITKRMGSALRQHWVHVLNHPGGRLLNQRPPYEYHLDQLLQTAKETGKALEINGSYLRMDLDDSSARKAKEQGVLLSLGSDAHSVAGLDAMQLAVAIARRAWLEPADVLNTLPLAELLQWLEREKL